jgi:hypothetical protein
VKNSTNLAQITIVRSKSQRKKEFTLRNLSLQTRVKIAVLVSLGALFAPIAAQAGSPTTVTSAGTVSLGLPTCTDTGLYPTSAAAKSVVLISDTLTANANSDGGTYIYFTETDTALWGAAYDYGQIQDQATCIYSSMSGTVTITRGRFISSAPAYTETTTNTVDFIQYVGNTKLTGVNSGAYNGSSCGNLTVSHAASVTASCSTGILANYTQLTQSGSVAWRDSTQTSGVNGNASSQAFVVVKVRKGAITGAPSGASFVSTETFTVTSV